jgi:hypothetical protein
MPTVTFASALQRHVACPPAEVSGATVREALDAAFQINARMRGYVLDDQSALRKHMTIFIDGRPISDRARQSDSVTDNSQIYVVQALSGG